MTKVTNIVGKGVLWLAVVGFMLTVAGCGGGDDAGSGVPTEQSIMLGMGVHNGVSLTPSSGTRADATGNIIYTAADMNGRQVAIFASEYAISGGSPAWTGSLFMNSVTGTVGQVTPSTGSPYYGISYSPLRYYDLLGLNKYDFMLVHPTSSGVTISPAGTITPYADVDLRLQPDLMLAKTSNVLKSGNPVAAEFHHKLAMVTITIQKKANMDQTVHVNEMSVRGNVMARYNIVTEAWSNYQAPGGKDSIVLVEPVYPHPTSDYEVPSEVDDAGQKVPPKHLADVFLFPVSLAESADASRRYTFTIVLNEVPYLLNLPDTEGAESWDAGSRYHYNIMVTGSDIYVEINKDPEIKRQEWYDEYIEKEII